MLLRFRVSNFRSFRDEQELSLIAGPFTDLPEVVRHPAGIKEGVLPGAAIYGANASGKTNVIKAVRFLASAVSRSHRDWRPDGPIPREPFMANEEREPTEIEADFLLAGVRHRYGFRVDSRYVLEEWLYVYPKGKKQTWFHRKRGSPIVFGNKMPGENRTIENLTRQNSLFLSAAAQNAHEALLPIFTWLSGLSSVIGNRSVYREHTAGFCSKLDYKNEIARLVTVADLGISEMSVEEDKLLGKEREIFEAFVTILNLNLPKEEVTSPETQLGIRFLHRFGNTTMPLSLDQESDGTLAYLALLGPAVDAIKKGTPLLIDELDASLHPLLAIQLVGLFNSPSSNPKGAQLIFNTHDTNLLSSGVLRRDQIWFTEKGNDATSHLYPLSDFKPRRQENLQNGYLQGRYGAIPFINPDAFLLRFEAEDVKA
jgi:AAA15 family ATPase/GTPase